MESTNIKILTQKWKLTNLFTEQNIFKANLNKLVGINPFLINSVRKARTRFTYKAYFMIGLYCWFLSNILDSIKENLWAPKDKMSLYTLRFYPKGIELYFNRWISFTVSLNAPFGNAQGKFRRRDQQLLTKY